MSSPLHVPTTDLPAGIIALRLIETHYISPHKVLVERERAHISGLIQQSFSGLAEISGKAATTVAAFQTLQDVLSEGRTYFFGTTGVADSLTDPLLALRRSIYELGKSQGFDRTLKHLRRNLSGTVEIEKRVYQKAEIEEMLLFCQGLEVKRLTAVHAFSRSIDDSVQTVSKDKHLQNTLCALAGLDNADKFAQSRKEEGRRTTKQLFEWNNSATTAYKAFNPALSYDGWLVSLANPNIS